MKFTELHYLRPDLNKFKEETSCLIEELKNSDKIETQIEIIEKINSKRSVYESMYNICYIRLTLNTADEFYAKEMDFFDSEGVIYEDIINTFYKTLTGLENRMELEKHLGSQLFALAGKAAKTYSEEISRERKEENSLTTEYEKFKGSAEVEFDGKKLNLPQLIPYFNSQDREVRKNAYEVRSGFFRQNQKKIDEIFDRLVKLRTSSAAKLGYPGFIPMAYDCMCRTDYDASGVAKFRDVIHKKVVPIAKQLAGEQKKRLGLDTLHYYDLPVIFKTGNPQPKGSPEELVEKAYKMYKELSPETGEFFEYMRNSELMDLVAKKGKAGGGYCTVIPSYNTPFIFSNFIGTADDINVLTHEAGHAFQVYMSRNHNLLEYKMPTAEACEINSIAMELLTRQWMGLFFEEEQDKFLYLQLNSYLTLLTQIATGDEFQHEIYANPDLSPAERCSIWRTIEKKYQGFKNYSENSFLDQGTSWYDSYHIFVRPFYYIDYGLALVCALQYWNWMEKDPAAAWASYLELCKQGGSKSFTGLIADAGLKSPFEEDCLDEVIAFAQNYLASVDDSNF